MTDKNNGMTAEEKLAAEVTADFENRQKERKITERGWQLNINFVYGNQYCGIDGAGEIVEDAKKYYWQHRKVFNHIAPIIDTRLSKLSRIRPALRVVAASDEESDRQSAALASSILAAASDDMDLDGVISQATMWSEICGTAFYKAIWNGEKGSVAGIAENGRKTYCGEAEIVAVPPFEIYPYSLSEENIQAQPSIIHAKAVPVEDIYAMYGVKTSGRDFDEFGLSPFTQTVKADGAGLVKTVKHGYELVIERYSRPTADEPEGRLTVVAGGKLVYDGILPYTNGLNGSREYPFIKQTSQPLAGSFFGASVVDRLIPVQRAYNAVKNRKEEFLNRISMGTVAVEDGSVDVDDIVEEGLMPGKVIVYRQGSTPPEMLALGSVPGEFFEEEKNLAAEFVNISGTENLSQKADSFAGIKSATGLQLVIEQDEIRLNVTYECLKRAIKAIGRQILRLYRQFANDVRLMKYAGENGSLTLLYFKGSDISSDDVVLESDSDLNMSVAQKRTVIYEMLDKGLFNDDNGKLTVSAKNKILALLGYGTLAGDRDIAELNRARAVEENAALKTRSAEVKDYDDHTVHINEHTAYLLTEKPGKDAEKRICAHIAQHRKKLGENEKGAGI